MSLPDSIPIHRPTKELEAAALIVFLFYKRVPQRCAMTGNDDKGQTKKKKLNLIFTEFYFKSKEMQKSGLSSSWTLRYKYLGTKGNCSYVTHGEFSASQRDICGNLARTNPNFREGPVQKTHIAGLL